MSALLVAIARWQERPLRCLPYLAGWVNLHLEHPWSHSSLMGALDLLVKSHSPLAKSSADLRQEHRVEHHPMHACIYKLFGNRLK